MRSEGVSHFAAHFDNVLTHGHRVYLSDFGLMPAQRFQLGIAEHASSTHRRPRPRLLRRGIGRHRRRHASRLPGTRERNEYVQGCADSAQAAHRPGRLANTVVRYAGIATAFNDLYWQLHGGDRTAPSSAR